MTSYKNFSNLILNNSSQIAPTKKSAASRFCEIMLFSLTKITSEACPAHGLTQAGATAVWQKTLVKSNPPLYNVGKAAHHYYLASKYTGMATGNSAGILGSIEVLLRGVSLRKG